MIADTEAAARCRGGAGMDVLESDGCAGRDDCASSAGPTGYLSRTPGATPWTADSDLLFDLPPPHHCVCTQLSTSLTDLGNPDEWRKKAGKLARTCRGH